MVKNEFGYHRIIYAATGPFDDILKNKCSLYHSSYTDADIAIKAINLGRG